MNSGTDEKKTLAITESSSHNGLLQKIKNFFLEVSGIATFVGRFFKEVPFPMNSRSL